MRCKILLYIRFVNRSKIQQNENNSKFRFFINRSGRLFSDRVEAKIVPFDVTITVEQKDKVIAIKKVEVIELLVKKERLPKIKGINVNYLNLLTEVPKYIVSQQA